MPQTDLLPRTFEFACRAVNLYCLLMKGMGPGRALAGQFLDAATSVAANAEEAQAAASRRDFISKQSIVLREARESNYWLRLFERCHIGDPRIVHPLQCEAEQLVRIFTAIVKNARGNTSG